MILWFCLTVSALEKLYQYLMVKIFLFDGFYLDLLHSKWLHNICPRFWEGIILIWSNRNSRKIILLALFFYTAINNTDKPTSRCNFAWQVGTDREHLQNVFAGSSLRNWQNRGYIKFHLTLSISNKIYLFFFFNLENIYLMTTIPRQSRMTEMKVQRKGRNIHS